MVKTGLQNSRGTQRQFSENIFSEDDLRSRVFGTFVVKFLACLPLLGFSNIYFLGIFNFFFRQQQIPHGEANRFIRKPHRGLANVCKYPTLARFFGEEEKRYVSLKKDAKNLKFTY